MAARDRNTLTQNFVAQSPAMIEVMRCVDLYSRARTPLLLVGATGTGKTTLAELIHACSGRTGPFSPHTAGEFDRSLEQSQIFGHERGAFTGAVDRHVGVLEEAGDGTLLLDDSIICVGRPKLCCCVCSTAACFGVSTRVVTYRSGVE